MFAFLFCFVLFFLTLSLNFTTGEFKYRGNIDILCLYTSRAMRKCVLCHMRTTKAQIRLDSIISLDSIAKISRL